jgi:dihydroneopterin aldolase
MAGDLIEIRGLALSCVIGAHPHEREVAQRLLVDVAMEVAIEEAAKKETLGLTVDYDAAAAQVTFLLESCRFRLLETAAYALAKLLLAAPAPGERRAPIASVRLTLTKPEALGRVGAPSLTLQREAAWARAAMTLEAKPWGSVDVVHETRDVGIYRLNVAPSAGIPLHRHQVMAESEMVLSEGLLCQGIAAPAGSVRRWAHGAPHRYDNPTDRWQTILCVDAPRFLPHDEVEVPAQGRPRTAS